MELAPKDPAIAVQKSDPPSEHCSDPSVPGNLPDGIDATSWGSQIPYIPSSIQIWLVVSNLLKNMKINWDDYFQYIFHSLADKSVM